MMPDHRRGANTGRLTAPDHQHSAGAAPIGETTLHPDHKPLGQLNRPDTANSTTSLCQQDEPNRLSYCRNAG
jgi:hypothetical protein